MKLLKVFLSLVLVCWLIGVLGTTSIFYAIKGYLPPISELVSISVIFGTMGVVLPLLVLLGKYTWDLLDLLFGPKE